MNIAKSTERMSSNNVENGSGGSSNDNIDHGNDNIDHGNDNDQGNDHDHGNDNAREDTNQLLKELEDTANKIRTDLTFCNNVKEKLKERGFDWFGKDNVPEDNNKEQVMKVFAAAVTEAIQKKVDLTKVNTNEVDKELCQLLDTKDQSLRPKFFKKNTLQNIKVAKSPLDLAIRLKRGVPQWFVENLIGHQFEMKWNQDTPTSEPDDYTFYQFCDKENTTQLFKYKPRRAHVQTTLYKECRTQNVVTLRAITREKLCPKVYVRVVGGWKSWKAYEQQQQQHTFNNVTDIKNDLSWIDPSILKFITENADEQKVDRESLADSLTKPTLYWAILNDTDFISGANLKLKPIGKTQVYVGKANNGIQGRWIKDSDNHCEMMKKCLDNVCAMTTYDPLKLEGIQLVDARLALAKVRRLKKSSVDGDRFLDEKSALFVIKTFGDDVEKAEIAQQKAQVCLDEAERKLTISSQQYSTRIRLRELRAEKQKRQDELDEATAVVNELKDPETTESEVEETTKAEAEAQLTRAEKLHRKGKRVHEPHKNIIPYKDYKMTWKPTDMGYGMNFN